MRSKWNICYEWHTGLVAHTITCCITWVSCDAKESNKLSEGKQAVVASVIETLDMK